jgi:hypothetical protein
MNEPQRNSICIVTPDYVSASSRTIKEADALSQAGFQVKVVFSQDSRVSAECSTRYMELGKGKQKNSRACDNYPKKRLECDHNIA